MADQRITQLTELTEAAVAANDVLPISDISASQTKKVTVKSLIEAGYTLSDAGSIDLAKLDQTSATKLATAALADDAITAAKLANDSSIAVDTTAPTTDNFDGRGYFNSSTGVLQVYSAGSYANVSASVGTGAVDTAQLADGAVTTDKVDAAGLGTAAIANDAITAAKIADDAVTADQLATGSVTTDAIAAGAVDTAELADAAVTYAKIQDTSGTDVLLGRSTAGAGTVEEITCTAAGRALLDDADAAAQRTTLGLGTLATANGTWTNGSTFSGTSSGTNTGDQTIQLTGDVTGIGTGTFAATIANDAVTSAKILAGAVTTAKIADDNVTAAKLANNSTAQTGGGAPSGSGAFTGQEYIDTDSDIIYYWDGAAWQNKAVSIPAATSSVSGTVKVGTGLEMNESGQLDHLNVVATGTFTKVTVDAQGHVTTGTTLVDSDVPSLPASKITTGTLNADLFGTNSITGPKLANSSTVQFGGAGSTSGVVTFPTADFKGQYFYDELNQDLYIWSGSAWLPITIISGELVLAGTYDASVNQVGSVTSAGAAAGLTAGAALPAASDTNNRYYLVVSDSGTGTGNAPAEPLAPPDMILSNGTTWELIDVSNAIAGQTATNISFTPYGNIAATNVQSALQELDDEKLTASGGTITGAFVIGTTGSLVFEGSTADAYETTLAVVDPTADRTIALPDVTGTVITTGDTGTVTNTMLAGSIADSKLSTISTTNKVALTALNIDGGTDIGSALVDGDLFIVHDGSNRKATASRITDYAFGKIGGDITISSAGTAAIGSGVIVNADINASAAIADTKLDTISTAGKVSGSAITSGTIGGSTAINTSGSIATTSTLALGQSSAAANTELDLAGTYAQTVIAVAALDINCSTGNYFTKTINGASTFTVSNVPASRAYAFTLELTHTSGTITWFSGVEWPGGTAPTLTTGKTHLFLFVTDDGGTRWRASSLINYTN